jgi:hypothetical protein
MSKTKIVLASLASVGLLSAVALPVATYADTGDQLVYITLGESVTNPDPECDVDLASNELCETTPGTNDDDGFTVTIKDKAGSLALTPTVDGTTDKTPTNTETAGAFIPTLSEPVDNIANVSLGWGWHAAFDTTGHSGIGVFTPNDDIVGKYNPITSGGTTVASSDGPSTGDTITYKYGIAPGTTTAGTYSNIVTIITTAN